VSGIPAAGGVRFAVTRVDDIDRQFDMLPANAFSRTVEATARTSAA